MAPRRTPRARWNGPGPRPGGRMGGDAAWTTRSSSSCATGRSPSGASTSTPPRWPTNDAPPLSNAAVTLLLRRSRRASRQNAREEVGDARDIFLAVEEVGPAVVRTLGDPEFLWLARRRVELVGVVNRGDGVARAVDDQQGARRELADDIDRAEF